MVRVILGGILAPCSAAQRHNLQILRLHAAIKELLLLNLSKPKYSPLKGYLPTLPISPEEECSAVSWKQTLSGVCCTVPHPAFQPDTSFWFWVPHHWQTCAGALQVLQCPLLQTLSLHFPGCCLTPSNRFHLTLARRKVPHSNKNRRQRALDDCMFIMLRAPHRGESHLTQKQLKHLLPTHTQNLYNSLCSHHTTHTPLTLELVILFTTGSLKSIPRLHSSCCYTWFSSLYYMTTLPHDT